jgi:exocyst complex component 1
LIELDGANVESILASKAEEKVLSLMQQIDSAIDEVETVEKVLDDYEEIMSNIRDSMEKMGEKNSMIEIANKNNIKLLQELERVISQLDLSHPHQLALTDPDLTTIKGLELAKDAGKALQNAMNVEIDPALLKLTAVQDQRKRFDKWKAKFSSTISRHLNNLFIHLGNDLGETTSQRDDLKLPHHVHHRELAAYQDLMHWLKTMDTHAYEALAKVYTSSLSKVYERDLRFFFTQAKQLVMKNHVHDEMNTSISGKSKVQPTKASLYGILGLPKDNWSSSAVDNSERQRFDSVLEKVLTELEPVALGEQMFCINFFQLSVMSPTKTSPTKLAITPNKDIPQKKLDRLINEEVRRMMSELFSVLEGELVNFIINFEKLDTFYSLYVFVRLNQHVMTAQDSQSFLSMTYASALVQVKRSFDKFMQLQLQSIEEAKVPKRSKCGLLCFVENFEEFTSLTESIFRKSERRTDLEKWYVRIVDAIFNAINQLSNEHPKTPSQVVKMENYHHMHSQLARLKVAALENQKKDSKFRYNEALKSYVTKYFGRPLEKLNVS